MDVVEVDQNETPKAESSFFLVEINQLKLPLNQCHIW